jgi:hypothetical protein
MIIFDDIRAKGEIRHHEYQTAVVYLMPAVQTLGINAMKRLAMLRDSRREKSIPEFGAIFFDRGMGERHA